jgi:hypothetical protein
MANYYGTPAIVTDGLVFAVDPGNDQSYVSGSLDTFSLVGSQTGSLENSIGWSPNNQGSWEFDGGDDNINFGLGSSFLPSAPFTVDIWVRQDDNDTCFFYSCNTPSMMTYYSVDKLYFDGGAGDDGQYITFIRDTNWRNIIWVNPATSGADDDSYYIDGVSVASVAAGGVSSQGDFLLGGRYSGLMLGGAIGNVKIYNKALTAAEALQNYNATKNRFI